MFVRLLSCFIYSIVFFTVEPIGKRSFETDTEPSRCFFIRITVRRLTRPDGVREAYDTVGTRLDTYPTEVIVLSDFIVNCLEFIYFIFSSPLSENFIFLKVFWLQEKGATGGFQRTSKDYSCYLYVSNYSFFFSKFNFSYFIASK